MVAVAVLQLIVTLAKSSPEALSAFFKKYAQTVLGSGGTVRGVMNHGVRELPERWRSKFVGADGSRYHWKGKFISTHVDVSPSTLADLERLLRTEDSVVRFFSLKQNTRMSHVGSLRKDNPFRPDSVNTAHPGYEYSPSKINYQAILEEAKSKKA